MSEIVVDNLKYCIHKSNKTATCLGFDKPSDQKTLIIPNNIRHNIKVTPIGNSAFIYCSRLTSVTLPDSLVRICNKAFRSCSGLTSVTFPASLTSIGDKAFCGCSGLTSVTLPASLTSIGKKAFYCCSSLISVTFPVSLTSIGNSAFVHCDRLTSVTFPESLMYIGRYAFLHCENLQHIYCEFDEEPFVDNLAFIDGPFNRTIHTRNKYIDMVPFYANKRVVLSTA